MARLKTKMQHNKDESTKYPLVTRKAIAVAALGIVLGAQVHALGLGEFRVRSALDQPLVAEIDLSSASAETLESLSVSLGSTNDFLQAGVDRSAMLQQLEFSVIGDRARPVIQVTTQQPFKEPYLRFLVSAQWRDGTLTKEYAALIDPVLYDPIYNVASSTPDPTDTSESVVGVPLASAPADQTVNQIATQASPLMSGLFSVVDGVAQYGPTQPGDTLWNVAVNFRSSSTGLNLFQIMLALFHENPHAFRDNNIHSLRVHKTLTLSDVEGTAQIPLESASLMFQSHLEEWQGLGSSEMAPDVVSSVSTDLSTGGETSANEVVTTTTPANISLTPVLEYKGLVDRVDSLANQVQLNTQRLLELQKSLTAMQQPVTDTTFADGSLAQPESPTGETASISETGLETGTQTGSTSVSESATLEESSVATDTAEDVTASVPTTQPAIADDVQTGDDQASSLGAVSGSDSQEEQAKITAIVSALSDGAVESSTTDPATPAVTDSVDGNQALTEVGIVGKLVNSFFNNLMWLIAGVLVLCALIVGVITFQRKRSSDQEISRGLDHGRDDDQYISGSGFDALPDTAGANDLAGEFEALAAENELELRRRSGTFTSTLEDFTTPGIVSEETYRPDALAEADLYLAYDNEKQAERVLLEAAAENPEQLELKYRLLDIYRARNDFQAFEATAKELYHAKGPDDGAMWDQVVAMGQELNIDDPLFTNHKPEVDIEAYEPDQEDSLLEPFLEPNEIGDLDLTFEEGGSEAASDEQSRNDITLVNDSFDVQDILVGSEPFAETNDVEILKEQVSSLQKAIAVRDHENEELQVEIKVLQTQAQDVEGSEVEELHTQIESMEKSLATRVQENGELQERVAQLENRVHEILAQLSDSESQPSSEVSDSKVHKLG